MDNHKKMNITDFEAQEIISAISRGEIDAFVINKEQKKEVSTLKRADYPYSIFVEAMNDGAVTLDPKGIVVFCNESMSKMLGITRKKLIGENLNNFVNRTDREIFANLLKEKTGSGEIFFRTGKNLMPVHISSRTIDFDQNTFHFVVVRDMSQQKYRAVVEDQTELICRWNRQSTIIFVNEAFCKYFGKSREQLIGQDFFGVCGIEKDSKFNGLMEKLTREDTVFTIELNISRPEGDGWLHLINRGIYNQAGQVEEFQSVFRDISDLYKAEKSLNASEMRYVSLAKHLPSILVRIDDQMKICYINQLVEEITGFGPEYFTGKDFRDIGYVSFDDLDKGEQAIRYVFKTKRKKEIEFSAQVETKRIDFSLKLAPEPSPEGDVRYVLGIITDISKIKLAESILERDRETLRKLVSEKSRELKVAKRLSDIGMLSATIAHELRNPLAAMKMATANIRRKTPDVQKVNAHLDIIERKVSESNQIINNLLFYSRLRPPEFAKVQIPRLLDETVSTALHNRSSITMTGDYSSIKRLNIDADPLQLSEVFMNILNNAADAVPAEGGHIRVTAKKKKTNVHISFTDNGEGMEPWEIEKITEPFFTTKAKGTGLGLTVVQQILHMHDGKLKIESKKGEGTTVNVIIPVHKRGRSHE